MILEDIYNRYSIEIQMEEVRQHRDNIMSNKLNGRKSQEKIFCTFVINIVKYTFMGQGHLT